MGDPLYPLVPLIITKKAGKLTPTAKVEVVTNTLIFLILKSSSTNFLSSYNNEAL